MSETEAKAPERTMFDCGCSVLKVRAGMCDLYAPDGTERPAKGATHTLALDVDAMRALAREAGNHDSECDPGTSVDAEQVTRILNVAFDDRARLASGLLAACDEIERLRRQAFIDPDGAGSILERVTQERDEARAGETRARNVAQAELNRAERLRERTASALDDLDLRTRELAVARAEIERMRPVVEAVVGYTDIPYPPVPTEEEASADEEAYERWDGACSDLNATAYERMEEAVKAYRGTPGASP